MQLMQQTGVPASVILGVAMVESSLGRSKNSNLLNNHFGIKGRNNLAAKGVNYRSQMKAYKSPDESYEHFVQLVSSKNFYNQLRGSLDFNQWLTNLNKAGYCATNGQRWMHDIEFMIEKYALIRFDKFVSWHKYETNFFSVLNR